MRDKKNWKRLIALAISAAMLVPAQVGYAMGEQAVESNMETYTESRTDDSDEFVIEDGQLLRYNGTATEVMIPEGVKHIGERAFSAYTYDNCSNITSVTIPEGVISIGDYAFQDCGSLTSMTIPEGVKRIGNGAFSGCSSLTNVTIPEGVKRIGDYVFSGCSSLTSMTIPEGVKRIGGGVFSECSSLTSVTIPKSVTSISAYAFSECSSLTSVTIPESVTSIGISAFSNCSNLTSMTIPEGVKRIGDYVFSGCSSLTSVAIPEGVTSIGDDAFSGTKWLENERAKNPLVIVNRILIDAQTSGGDVTIPEGVTSISAYAFFNCSSLTSVTIPESVTSIGQWAFLRTKWLENERAKNPLVIVNRILIDAQTSGGDVTIPEGVTSISAYAFSDCSSLTSVTIPESVTSIGEYAFSGCSLTSLTIPESMICIGKGAFMECSSLASVTIPESVTSIGAVAYSGTKWLENERAKSPLVIVNGMLIDAETSSGDVTIPEGVTSIGNGAFSGCRDLTSVAIPEGVTSIGDGAFSDCSTSLTSVVIPESVTSIGDDAFHNCNIELIIYGKTGSYAETYAGENNFEFSTGEPLRPGEKKELSDEDITISQTSYVYDGEAKTPTVTVKYTDEILKEDIDYTVDYQDNVNAGTAKVIVTGMGNYTGTVTKTFTITQNQEVKEISECTITLSQTSYTYDGKAKTPSVTVKLDGKTLTLNTDYTVSYSDNINAGTAKVTVTGKGNYTGSKTVNFTIAKAGQDSSITCKKTLYKVAYGTKPFKINAASKSKLTFTSSKPKIVSVNKNTGKVTIKNTGIAIITIKAGKDSVKVTVKVSPKKQAVKSVNVSKGKKLTVKWAKDKTASGYQVQVSTDRKFKKGVRSKNLSKTSYTFTKLKAGRKYYVRMRSYKKSGKETLYSTWSKTKTSNKVKK